MNNNSPVTELLIESFDQLLDNKHINLKYNTLIQLSILFILFSTIEDSYHFYYF